MGLLHAWASHEPVHPFVHNGFVGGQVRNRFILLEAYQDSGIRTAQHLFPVTFTELRRSGLDPLLRIC